MHTRTHLYINARKMEWQCTMNDRRKNREKKNVKKKKEKDGGKNWYNRVTQRAQTQAIYICAIYSAMEREIQK